MRNESKKLLAAILGLTLFVGACTGCSILEAEEEPEEEIVEEPPRIVTIVDGQKEVTVEDADQKTIPQILEEAAITLEEGDVLTVDPACEDLTLHVLHRVTVTIVDQATNYPEETEHTIVFVGGTIEDALEAAGIEMNETMETNFAAGSELKNKMLIVVTDPQKVKEAEEKAAAEAAAAEAARRAAANSSSSSSGRSSGSSSGGGRSSGGGGGSSKPTKTVVNTSVYYDCDGSGHGVKVITYSDGSQQEVTF